LIIATGRVTNQRTVVLLSGTEDLSVAQDPEDKVAKDIGTDRDSDRIVDPS
jgi:hypothetical protein